MVIKHDEFLKCNTGFFYGELEYIIIELQDANKYDHKSGVQGAKPLAGGAGERCLGDSVKGPPKILFPFFAAIGGEL